jgi:glycosyltransferase involved in cell wall biosynthesis
MAAPNNQPLVSVFVPTYNHAQFIAECLDSIFSQDYENFEVICGDDCSSDETAIIMGKYEAQYPEKFKGLYNKENLGVTRNCNNILKNCKGKYVIMFSGDDVMLPGKISKLVNYMENNSGCSMCCHDLEVFDNESNKVIGRYSDIATPPGTDAESILQPGVACAGPMYIVRKDAIPAEGFNELLNTISDWLFLIEVAAKGSIGYIPEILTRYRRHHNNLSNRINYYHEYYVAIGILRSKYPFLMNQLTKFEGFIFFGFMVNYLRAEKPELAFACAKESYIRKYKRYLLFPILLVFCFRIGLFRDIIDAIVLKLFRLVDIAYKAKRINYKLYQKKK